MKVFISWSGDKSRNVAVAFHDWLPLVLHSVQPFVSSKDIRAGTRWQSEVAAELDETDFGLICVTRQNVAAPWLNFEAGALAKAVDSSRVVPLAVDLSPAQVPNPLGQFQASTLKMADIEATVRSINEACSTSIAESNLGRTFEKWWPDLEQELEEIQQRDYGVENEPTSPERSDREMLEELLDSVRGFSREGADPPARLRPSNDLIDDIQEISRRNEVPWISMGSSDGHHRVTFSRPATKSLIRDLNRLEELSGVRIEPVFPETKSRDSDPTPGSDN